MGGEPVVPSFEHRSLNVDFTLFFYADPMDDQQTQTYLRVATRVPIWNVLKVLLFLVAHVFLYLQTE